MSRSSWFAPVPPSVAIEIARGRVCVAGLSGGGGASVSAYAAEALPAEAVQPALSGENIPDRAVVVGALRRALERAGLRSVGRAALVVPDSIARVSLLTFDALPSRAADFDQLVRWQLKKALPFPIDQAQVTHFPVHGGDGASTVAAVAVRREVVAEYEAVAEAAGIRAGLVDLASFSVMNGVIGAGAAAADDWLLVHLAAEATTLAILRGESLMFYRHRMTVEDEPLSALVHQTAMYHEDRLGGRQFARVWLSGAGARGGDTLVRVRADITERLGLQVETVDIRPAASLQGRMDATAEVLDTLAAPVGVLLRERKAA